VIDAKLIDLSACGDRIPTPGPGRRVDGLLRGYSSTMGLHDILRRTESLDAVDGPADVVARVSTKVLGRGKVARLLRGAWLGHPVHPLLVTMPIGAWTSAAVLDCVGKRAAARQLIGVGLLTVPATALAGLADVTDLTKTQRRTAVMHAAVNAAATVLQAASYLCRVRGRHPTGIALTATGLVITGVGGALGGHLTYAQGGGVHRFQSPPFVRRP
jgi:uncharacterized membrane protein